MGPRPFPFPTAALTHLVTEAATPARYTDCLSRFVHKPVTAVLAPVKTGVDETYFASPPPSLSSLRQDTPPPLDMSPSTPTGAPTTKHITPRHSHQSQNCVPETDKPIL